MTDWERYPHFDLDYQARDEAWHRRVELRELALDAAWELRPQLSPGSPALANAASWLDNGMAENPEGPEMREELVQPKPPVMDKRQLWLEFERIA